MKMKRKVEISFIIFSILCLSAVKVVATSSEFQYSIVNSEAKITGLSRDVDELIIPSAIGGFQVTTIGEEAFMNKYFKVISIPNTVRKIENKAFYGVTIYGDRRIMIPASVEDIGLFSFSYMDGVEAFEVEEGNKKFTSQDGVLFTAVKKQLINYPINKPENTYIVPRETVGLDCTSFGNVKNLKHLIVSNENPWMASYTFFGCDLTLYGLENTNLHYSVISLEEEDYAHGKVKFIPIDVAPVNIELLSVYYGRNTNFFDVHIDLSSNDKSNFLSFCFNIPKGKYLNSSVSEGTLANIDSYGKGAFYGDFFSSNGFKNCILTLTYEMDNIPNSSIECELSYEAPYYQSGYDVIPYSFYPCQTFQDCTKHWAKDAIYEARGNGVLWWVRNDNLKPDQPITRAEFVTSLASVSNDSLSDDIPDFDDVPKGSFYVSPVNWAIKSGLIQGVGNGLFAPDNKITREEIAVLLMRFLNYKSINVDTKNYKTFADENLISDWARKGVMVMQTSGIMNGVGENQFNPKGLITRAETAVLLHRFQEEF